MKELQLLCQPWSMQIVFWIKITAVGKKNYKNYGKKIIASGIDLLLYRAFYTTCKHVLGKIFFLSPQNRLHWRGISVLRGAISARRGDNSARRGARHPKAPSGTLACAYFRDVAVDWSMRRACSQYGAMPQRLCSIQPLCLVRKSCRRIFSCLYGAAVNVRFRISRGVFCMSAKASSSLSC